MAKKIQLDLSRVNLADLAETSLSTADAQMDEYETRTRTRPFNENNWVYLHTARTNILYAEKGGLDTTTERERLTRLEKQHQRQVLKPAGV